MDPEATPSEGSFASFSQNGGGHPVFPAQPSPSTDFDLTTGRLARRETQPVSYTPLVRAMGEKLARYNEALAETTAFRASIGNSPVTIERLPDAVLLSTKALVLK